ncbi:MAG: DUF1501 domain-containing protein [Pyrinomonadaceae bacterium]
MTINRRYFLKSGGVALAAVGLTGAAPSFLERAALAETRGRVLGSNRRKTLIAIFQRGAVDGLNAIVPYGERAYYDLRPTIAIAQPGRFDAALDLDGFFGLHPALASLKPFWDQQQLGIIHAVGSPHNTRSHFDAQDYMESGTPGIKSTADGWLNRYLQSTAATGASPFRGLAIGSNMPRVLQGKADALAMSDLTSFSLQAGSNTAQVQGGFEALYEKSVNDALGETGRETFEAVKFLKRVNPSQYQPENNARYPRGRFGAALLQIAQLIKAGVGLEIAFTDSGGWDTHINQGSARGQLALRLQEFGEGIAALVIDLGSVRMEDVLILTMSEFGRTVRENGTRGTDHGHANAMLVLGGGVRGGKVYGEWPGLANERLFEERDLALTTDFRDVFGEVAQKHLGHTNLRALFPTYAVNPAKFRGLLV